MNDEDREELLWRRVAEKVVEGADRQIKGRYFWAALIFAVASWFGGAALITSIVQLRVAEKMEPAQMAVAQAKLLTEQLSASLTEAQKSAAKLTEALKDTNQKLDVALSNEGNLERQLQAFQSAAQLAFDQFNDRVKILGTVVTQSEAGQGSRAEAIAKLDAGHITIRVGAGVPKTLAADLAAKIGSQGKFTVTMEGGREFVASSSLRYFYLEDAALAAEIERVVADVLKQSGIDNRSIPLVDLSGRPIKPPQRTVEMWLNVADGKLL
ncbi:hypothetical protein BRAS3843_2790023 [Bradyrhizobium sp. STM 3843]|uniref:hypothetical protein n=1 Tax=Bradyrhizobium sp. STM 3843 TaxID=551947 RepID=UPI000240495F|nr:hypothetical protein [Bradyrhizobium sp. STM 3843]CCE08670.1 hypothetical protein BRAS3843_2790023 [Bradyrhizobium sp. STM 3843]